MDTEKNREDKDSYGRLKQKICSIQQILEVKQRPPLRTLSTIVANTSINQARNMRLVKPIADNNKTANAERNKENISPCISKILSNTHIGNNKLANVALKRMKCLPSDTKVYDNKNQVKSATEKSLENEYSSPVDFRIKHAETRTLVNRVPQKVQSEARSGCSTLWEYETADLYTRDILNYLLKIENRLKDTLLISNYLRACVVERFIRRSAEADIDKSYARLVQYASWYLDHYLSMAVNVPDELYNLGWACFWLASKVDGNKRLSTMIVNHARRYGFLDEVIRHERVILQKLNFPTHPVIPSDYITFLAKWCDKTSYAFIEEVAIFISLCGVLRDKYFNAEYPSVIAAASVIISLEYTEQSFLSNRLYLCPVYEAASKKTPNLSEVFDRLKTSCRLVLESECLSRGLVILFSRPPYYILPRIKRKLHL